jgi:hypothetical protein
MKAPGMADDSPKITVEDVRKLALPLETRVVAGGGAMSRTVTWTTVIALDDPSSFKPLQASEMALGLRQ